MAGQTYAVYFRMSIKQLNQLRSRKYLELNKIVNLTGHFAGQDKRRLAEQIRVIDVVLAQKTSQMSLPE